MGRFSRSNREGRLDAELRSHLEQLIADGVADGMPIEEARRRAHLEFGGLLQVREAVQDTWRWSFVETALRDVRYAIRALIASPGFTAVAALSLAIGIGANTAVFSGVDRLLLRPLAVRDPQTLTFLAFPRETGYFDSQFSGPEFHALDGKLKGVFADTSAMIFGGLLGPTHRSDGLTIDDVTRPVQTLFVSGNFFQMLGIQPYLGRLLLPAEGRVPGADPVVVLGYRYWQARFRGDPTIVGKRALVNGEPFTVVGVAPKGFLGPTPIVDMDAYLPLAMRTVETGDRAFLNDPAARDLVIVARLGAGVSRQRANAALASVGAVLVKAYPRPGDSTALQARALRPPGLVNGPNPLPALAALFFVLAGLVFALACLNVTNLTLIRAIRRHREIAVRSALGASRARIARQLMTETILLALIGSAGGLLAAALSLRELSSRIAMTGLPLTLEFPLDAPVFAFAIVVAIGAAAIVGVVPAIRASGGNLTGALRDGGRTATGRGQRVRTALVAMQVAGTLTLLIVAGLFTRSLDQVQHADLGFRPEHVLNVRLDPGEVGYNEARGLAFFREILARARALPGVQSASLAMTVPLADDPQVVDIGTPGTVTTRGEHPHADDNAVSPDYFRTMSIPLLSGRDFTDADDASRPRVAIVNEIMADRFWHHQNPIGRTFTIGADVSRPIEIVGVVKNSRTEDPFSPLAPAFYVPLAQAYASTETLLIRMAGSQKVLVPAILATAHAIAPEVPVVNVRTMIDAVDNGDSGFFIFNVGAMLTAALGLLGLALALVGMYGVMAHAVGQRTNEIGIRLALGARRSQILWLVSRQTLVMVSIGLASGTLVALGVGRLVGRFLVGIGPTDPVTFVSVSILLIAAALAACYRPVRRAMRVDPAVALRHE